jgi:hypothetical protein
MCTAAAAAAAAAAASAAGVQIIEGAIRSQAYWIL